MKQQSSGKKQQSAKLAALGVLIVIPFFVLYWLLATKMGIWEPWESEVVDWGVLLGSTDGASPILPIARGDFVPVPWLRSFLATWSAGDGASPAALRLPWVALATLSVGVITYCYGRIFGFWHGMVIGAVYGFVPCIFLSAANLAGIMPFAATYSCAIATYSLTRRSGSSGLSWIAFGFFAGLTMWAGLLPGLAAVLYTLLGFHVAEYPSAGEHSKRRITVAFLLFAASGLLFMLGLPGASSSPEVEQHVAHGLVGYVTLPLAGFVFFSKFPSQTSEHRSIYQFTGALVTLVLVAFPIIRLLSHLSAFETTAYLLDPQPIVENDVSGAPFSDLIRIAGFALFPLTALFFYGMDYIVRTASTSFTATDFGSTGVHDAKLLLISSAAATFGIYAVTYRTTGIVLFAMPLSVAATIALSLTDFSYLRWLSQQATLRRLHAITAAVVMLILSKDVRGMLDEEGGRPGPRVMFEFITGTETLRIPDTFAFDKMRVFVLFWMGLIVAGWLFGPAVYSWWTKRKERETKDSVIQRLVEATGAVWMVGAIFFCSLLGFAYVPQLDAHFSSESLTERLSELETEDSILAVQDGAEPWTLRDRELQTFESPNELRSIFCESETRVFAAVDADDLPEYHEDIRTADQARRRDCEAGFHVLYGSSKRFALVSNQLNTDEGEADEGLFAEAVVDEADIPDSATRFDPAWDLDGKVELIAAEISPTALVSGSFEVATWWRVKEEVRRDYQMFIHVDGPGSRINGDHDLVGGDLPITRWVPGDIVVDRYTMEVNLFGDAKGVYSVMLGLFDGDDRMSVTPDVPEDRIEIGKLRVKWPFGLGGI